MTTRYFQSKSTVERRNHFFVPFKLYQCHVLNIDYLEACEFPFR